MAKLFRRVGLGMGVPLLAGGDVLSLLSRIPPLVVAVHVAMPEGVVAVHCLCTQCSGGGLLS
jgi:hypothetical protein